jgi:hypothetical protein
MAEAKISQAKKQPNQPKAPEIPGDYYLDREQLDSMRHLILAAQGISKEFTGQDEVKAIGELFQGFSNGLSSIMETIEGQRIEKGGVS